MLPPTPALVVDSGLLDANLAAMQARADAAGVRLRPHVKGHKSAWVAGRQLARGACGLAAATVEEVAGLIAAGHGGDVLLTSVLSPRRVDDVVALRRAGDVAVVVDAVELPGLVAERARAAGVTVRVLLDLDIGQRRGAARTPSAAVAIADAVAREGDVLVLAGVQAYEGHLQLLPAEERAAGHARAMDVLREMLDAVRARGHAIPLVTSAGTGTAALVERDGAPLVNEVQPGSYALMDAKYAAAGAEFANAATVASTVLSAPGDGEVLVDAGLKAVSIDHGPPTVLGLDATWASAGDEHGRVSGDVGHLRPGDRLVLHPSHTDTTVRLHRTLWLAREGDDVPPLALPLF